MEGHIYQSVGIECGTTPDGAEVAGDASSSDPELADRERLLLDRRRKLTPK